MKQFQGTSWCLALVDTHVIKKKEWFRPQGASEVCYMYLMVVYDRWHAYKLVTRVTGPHLLGPLEVGPGACVLPDVHAYFRVPYAYLRLWLQSVPNTTTF